jgi:hypothetical protein
LAEELVGGLGALPPRLDLRQLDDCADREQACQETGDAASQRNDLGRVAGVALEYRPPANGRSPADVRGGLEAILEGRTDRDRRVAAGTATSDESS